MSPPTAAQSEQEILSAWLATHVPRLTPPLDVELIAGGRSNLTYCATDATGTRVVVRRPPRGPLLPSAHDVVREHRIISALGPTVVPVPRALALCEDADLLGAPFYVMDFVDGVVVRDREDAERALDPTARRRASDALIDALVDLHAIDPAAVGLGDLGAREDYVGRQLRRWKRQFDGSRRREVPAIDEAHALLSAAVPPQRRTGIVHGDVRLDNCVLAPDGSAVRAILDWELCTLGDPLADLALLLVYWSRPGPDEPTLMTGDATRLDGFRERDELVARYTERSGADTSDIRYFMALAYWKLACIFEGIYTRYADGVMDDDETEPAAFAAQAESFGASAVCTAQLIR